MNPSILQPLVVLALWSFVMWIWLYATRIPALRRIGAKLDPTQSREAFNAALPARVRWKADNYNHLMEQPTVFYAVVLAIAMLGAGDRISVALAWAYAALRIVHSLVQAMVNIILLRFSIFMLSSVVLLVLTLRAASAAFPSGLPI